LKKSCERYNVKETQTHISFKHVLLLKKTWRSTVHDTRIERDINRLKLYPFA